MRYSLLSLFALLATTVLPLASSKAILGVDLGSLYMKVALVQRGAPLEIVTNLHSKRKTENMILFDQNTRFFGSDASSLLARKPLKTPSAMSVLLGKEHDHPTVEVLSERHYPLMPQYNETRSGVCLTVDGIDFTPEELVAMVLTHAKDITKAYGSEQGKDASTLGSIQDCVLTVPSFATQHERRALLDAAALADLNVLALIDETTAAALHYGMDKSFEDNEQVLIFYNLGASALQVSIVRFFSYLHKESKYSKEKMVTGIEVLGKAWDSTLGGNALDHVIVEYLADEFNSNYKGSKGDVRTNTRSMTKLRLQANKVKHVLSANTEIPIYIDALFDDTPLDSHLTRAHLENLAHDILARAVTPIDAALQAANITLEQVHGIELIGGGMRVPKIQEALQTYLGEHVTELGMHINSDESMALGAAFHGANISTAFKVRHVGLTDVNPFAIQVSLEEYESDASSKKKKADDEEPWSKQAVMFKSFGKVGVKKTIAFTHDKDVHCAIDYAEDDLLPKGTSTAIESYNITGVEEFSKEMEAKGLGKPKISLQFELSTSGITKLVKAEAAVEEIVIVQEEVEIEEDEDDKNATVEESDDKATATEDKVDAGDDEKESSEDKDGAANETEAEAASNETDTNKTSEETPKKERKTKMVDKEKKKVHKQALKIETYHVGRVRPYSVELMDESKAKLAELARKDKERMMLEEARNNVESYIYKIKNKLMDDEEAIGKVTTEEQRAELSKMSEAAEEWMYEDGYSADLATMQDKYAELSTPMEKVLLRVSEMEARPAMIKEMQNKLTKVEELMKKWETTMPQVTEDERKDVLTKVEEFRAWMAEKEEAQAKAEPTEDPVFLSTDVPAQTKDLEILITRLSRRPKPKKEKKNETKSEGNETATEGNATDAKNETSPEEEDKVETSAEGTTEETKPDEAGEDEL